MSGERWPRQRDFPFRVSSVRQAAGLTRVKTGSLQEVSSMTGNVSREQGGVAAFAVIVNNPEDFEATRTAINEFVAGLAAL